MSGEAVTSAIFLISAVLASAILINAFFPVLGQTSSTFSDTAQSSEELTGTELKITYVQPLTDRHAYIFVKNTGTIRLTMGTLNNSELFLQTSSKTIRLSHSADISAENTWMYKIYHANNNTALDPGESMELSIYSTEMPIAAGEPVTFQYSLPNGLTMRSSSTVYQN